MIIKLLKRTFRLLASLKVAIPLLVITIAVTIIGSLFPQPDMFKTWWYLGLLALNGISLLFITILHIPSLTRRKGRNAMIGVVTTHLGILILIAGIIYGGVSGFRHTVKLIENEITIVPGLPFVIQLDELLVEEYDPDDFRQLNPEALPKKKQESRITLLKNGKAWQSLVVAPGWPAKVDGITLLPSVTDIGWCFDLIVTNPQGRDRMIPVRPWAPPLITIGSNRIITHGMGDGDTHEVELFAIRDDRPGSLGFAGKQQAVEIDGYSVSLGPVKRYTGLRVYNRPQEPVLVLGSILMLGGLVWHFYHRHRARRQRKGTPDA